MIGAVLAITIIGCAPAKLETNIKDKDTGNVIEPPPDPIGVVPADDCQQIDIGDKACNFILKDQNGNTWQLYDHIGDVIVLDFSSVWCYPCKLAAAETQALQNAYADEGVQVVTVLIDGPDPGIEPTEYDVQQWAALGGITTAPVLQGSREKMLDPQDGSVAEPGVTGYLLNAYPTYIYIGRDMKFYTGHVGFSEEYIKQKIEEGL